MYAGQIMHTACFDALMEDVSGSTTPLSGGSSDMKHKTPGKSRPPSILPESPSTPATPAAAGSAAALVAAFDPLPDTNGGASPPS